MTKSDKEMVKEIGIKLGQLGWTIGELGVKLYNIELRESLRRETRKEKQRARKTDNHINRGH